MKPYKASGRTSPALRDGSPHTLLPTSWAAYGAESAADLHFMLGWINASMGDRAYGKASGMFGVSTNNASNGLYKIAEYYTLSDLAAV